MLVFSPILPLSGIIFFTFKLFKLLEAKNIPFQGINSLTPPSFSRIIFFTLKLFKLLEAKNIPFQGINSLTPCVDWYYSDMI